MRSPKAPPPSMRGYFGIGVESISKSGNLGNLVRSAHAFGASFFFTINSQLDPRELQSTDTSHASEHLPFYRWDNLAATQFPHDCVLVGVELTDRSGPLPSFRHPPRAAYVLGPELGSLSPELQARCKYLVQIPGRFCVNVGIAGALVMYDRLLCLGQHNERPVRVGF